jgi:hypothetical protein
MACCLRSLGDGLRGRDARELTPYEAVLCGWSFSARIIADEHGAVRGALEHAAEHATDHADVWALLSVFYVDEYREGFNLARTHRSPDRRREAGGRSRADELFHPVRAPVALRED